MHKGKHHLKVKADPFYKLGNTTYCQKTTRGEAWKRFFLAALQRNQPCQYLNLISGLQYYETIHFCFSTSPSLWYSYGNSSEQTVLYHFLSTYFYLFLKYYSLFLFVRTKTFLPNTFQTSFRELSGRTIQSFLSYIPYCKVKIEVREFRTLRMSAIIERLKINK